MSRLASRTIQSLLDLAALALAFWLAFLIRFDWDIPPHHFKQLVVLVPYVVAFQYLVLLVARVPRFAWRYVGLHEVNRIFVAISASSAVLLAGRLFAQYAVGGRGYARYGLIPIGVLFINWLLSFGLVAGVRVLRRMLGERAATQRHRASAGDAVPTLLIGAGEAGVMVARESTRRPDLAIEPVGFLDDDPTKVGQVVQRIPVLGSTGQLREVYQRTRARQVLITIASLAGKDARRIHRLCEEADIPVKIIPGFYEIVSGQVNITRIRNVALEDLLGREQVHLDQAAIQSVVRGKVVMVTGAGGSIGSELCRQIVRYAPAALLLVERAENSLFTIHRELIEWCQSPAGSGGGAPCSSLVIPCLADICDQVRMEGLFRRHHPSVVLHAAAHKHVPMMEWNPAEAIRNNVMGTRTLARISHREGVGHFVMISTDKAVNPSSVMGATKRVAEHYVQALSQQSRTRFVTVRFGNVLGSAGSVIPVFREQIERGGPVTVTHPEMRRYFMTIPEACQLVLQAATMGKGGEIFILDMGEPIRILDLARDLIALSGLRPGVDVEIRFTGMRPGEKLFEEIATSEEQAAKTRHPKIFIGRFEPPSLERVDQNVDRLLQAATQAARGMVPDQDNALRLELSGIVTEYSPDLTERSSLQVEEEAGTVEAGEELSVTPGGASPGLS